MCGAGRDARVTTVFYLEVKLIIYLEVGCATLSSLDGSLPRQAPCAPTTARKRYDAQGDVLINWLSKCRGGTTPPTLGLGRAVMGALHASVPTTRAC